MKWRVWCVLAGLSVVTVLAYAQGKSRTQHSVEPNPSYDGRYAFVRLRYSDELKAGCMMSSEGPGWRHDYPMADRSVMKIITMLTSLNARIDSSLVIDADDPELMKYPILYLSEPGCWRLSESEVKALRKYLLKGGFLIVDDFRYPDFGTARVAFEQQIRRVFPEGQLMPITRADPVFNGFFELDPLQLFPSMGREPPRFIGIYERNDSKKRLMVAANYNNDIGDYWQASASGFRPVATTNEAYKIGVNYFLYGFTH